MVKAVAAAGLLGARCPRDEEVIAFLGKEAVKTIGKRVGKEIHDGTECLALQEKQKAIRGKIALAAAILKEFGNLVYSGTGKRGINA